MMIEILINDKTYKIDDTTNTTAAINEPDEIAYNRIMEGINKLRILGGKDNIINELCTWKLMHIYGGIK